MVILFRDSFECPPNTAPSTFTAWTSTDGTPTIITSPVHHGTYALSCDLSAPNYVIKNLGSAYSTNYTRFYVRFSALPPVGKYRSFVSFYDAVDSRLIYFELWNNGGAYTWWFDAAGALVTNTTFTPQINTWYCVEMAFNVTATVHKVYLDGVEFLSATQDFSAQPMQILRLGSTPADGNDWVGTVYVDCVVVSDAYIGCERRFLPLTRNMNPRYRSRTLQHM